MKSQRLKACVFFLFFANLVSCSLVSPARARAEAQRDAAYEGKRRQAIELFDQGKRLEALPLLEALVQKNPKDGELLVDLAASLIRHAATLGDPEASAKERLRAKNVVEQALDSGNHSPLALNLRQLLEALPANGSIQFSENPSVEQAMLRGEAAFSRRDFAEAIQSYAKALELEPNNYTAALFTGNTYHKQNDYARAAKWYERAIQLDPNVETAYRYYGEMLVKQGDMSKARTMFIHAAVAEPYNRIVWRDLLAWADINRVELDFKYAGLLSDPRAQGKDESLSHGQRPHPKDLSDAWQAYQAVRMEWKDGGKFKQHFPREASYRHSLAEEVEALTAEINALEKLEGDVETAEMVTENPSLLLLLKLHQAGVLGPYVLFRLADEDMGKDYSNFRSANRGKLEQYLDTFVVPHPPGRTTEVLTAPARHGRSR